MKPYIRTFTMFVFLIAFYVVLLSVPALPQTGAQPPLFFREGWNGKTEGVKPLTQATFENPSLVVQLYGPGTYSPGRDSETTLNINVRKVGDEASSIVWSGMAEGNWAVTMKHRDNFVDLSRPGSKIRWRTWQEGVSHILRPVLKLADGKYVLGLQGSGPTADYETTEWIIADMRWVEFDHVRVLDTVAANPDLSRVDEIGFTTLSRGGGHGKGVSAHVDWIEVYGFPVPRSGQATTR